MIHTDIHTHLAGQNEPGCRPMGQLTIDRTLPCATETAVKFTNG
ncbi:MAG: hypothetical protein WBB29_06630 [Geitlerinemataceae cyanobacterium]